MSLNDLEVLLVSSIKMLIVCGKFHFQIAISIKIIFVYSYEKKKKFTPTKNNKKFIFPTAIL